MPLPTMKIFRITAAASAGAALVVCGATFAEAATGVATTTVNVRTGPGTSHRIEGGLVRGQRITVTKSKAGWATVRFGNSRGYVASRYLDLKGSRPAVPSRIRASGTKLVMDSLNVRSGPGTNYRVVGRLPQGRRITLVGQQRRGFAQTRFGGHVRWVSVAYLAKVGGRATPAPKARKPAPRARKSPMPKTSAAKGRAAVAYAKRQLGKPYLFGAEGPRKFDCSGLVMMAWRSVGVSLPRVARWQYAQGHHIAKSQLRTGDLVFFYTQVPRHVGIYVGNGMIIDAPRPGKVVRYAKITRMPYSGAVRPI
jgi:cell wall-associated NlpC family hydrolase